ncbi:hypothetical protein CEP53_004983 [Fusarium sp. AF-6]|nr:hypothetical protein CEP53_004983 [Fusarium sp. AF-6]
MLSWSAISIRHRVLNEIARARNSPHAQYIDSARAVVLAIRNCPSLALPTPPPNVNIRRPEMLQHHHHKLAVDLQPLQSPAARNEMGVARPQFAQTPEAPNGPLQASMVVPFGGPLVTTPEPDAQGESKVLDC